MKPFSKKTVWLTTELMVSRNVPVVQEPLPKNLGQDTRCLSSLEEFSGLCTPQWEDVLSECLGWEQYSFLLGQLRKSKRYGNLQRFTSETFGDLAGHFPLSPSSSSSSSADAFTRRFNIQKIWWPSTCGNLQRWVTTHRQLSVSGRNSAFNSVSDFEPIGYILHRRRWYDMLCNLDNSIQLSDQLRGVLLLDHANLSHNEKLMTMTHDIHIQWPRFWMILAELQRHWSSNMRLHTRSKLLMEEWRPSRPVAGMVPWRSLLHCWLRGRWGCRGIMAMSCMHGIQTTLRTHGWRPGNVMMKTGEWTAWFGDTASWDEASTPADAYKERLAQQNLEGDCEQIAMEVPSAYLSNEDQHAYLGKGKSKGYGKGKKGMSKGMKGKGYGKSKR